MKCPYCQSTDNEPGAVVCHNCGKPLPNNNSIPEPSAPQGVEAIDLGLSSGTKWASCNVGATKPEECGAYYAWGETEEKEMYEMNTYVHRDEGKYLFIDLGKTICGTKLDVAHVKWGGAWQMPSVEQIEELIKECKFERTTQNGIAGCKFTGPNSNSIFLPYAITRQDTDIPYRGIVGHYMSGTQKRFYQIGVHGLIVDNINPYVINIQRFCGHLVRPVHP